MCCWEVGAPGRRSDGGHTHLRDVDGILQGKAQSAWKVINRGGMMQANIFWLFSAMISDSQEKKLAFNT